MRRCPHCKALIYPDVVVITDEEFKTLFKVGDLAEGYSTSKRVLITAIGKDRFLYISPDSTRTHKTESVSLQSNPQARWRKPHCSIERSHEYYY